MAKSCQQSFFRHLMCFHRVMSIELPLNFARQRKGAMKYFKTAALTNLKQKMHNLNKRSSLANLQILRKCSVHRMRKSDCYSFKLMRKMKRYRSCWARGKKWTRDLMTKKENKKMKIRPKVRRSMLRKHSLNECTKSWITRVKAQHFKSKFLKSSRNSRNHLWTVLMWWTTTPWGRNAIAFLMKIRKWTQKRLQVRVPRMTQALYAISEAR